MEPSIIIFDKVSGQKMDSNFKVGFGLFIQIRKKEGLNCSIKQYSSLATIGWAMRRGQQIDQLWEFERHNKIGAIYDDTMRASLRPRLLKKGTVMMQHPQQILLSCVARVVCARLAFYVQIEISAFWNVPCNFV